MSLRRLGVLVIAVVALVAAPLAFRLATPDAPPPAGLHRPVAEFGTVLANQLDQPPLTHARFVGAETGDDDLVILLFELRPYPYIGGRLAYLVSRCVAPAALDPMGMGGGFIDGDRASDVELAYLRSDAQPPCSPA
jgi:hypothetical protein